MVIHSDDPDQADLSVPLQLLCQSGPCTCGDLDGNGIVNLNDLATFVSCFGLGVPVGSCDAVILSCSDLDGIGGVDLNDFLTFVQAYDTAPTNSPPNCP